MSEPQGLDNFLAQSTPSATVTPAATAGEPAGLSEFIGPELLEENYGGPTGALVTGASHVINSALPGVGPVLQNAVGLDYETQKKLALANPVSAGVGDIAGFIRGVGAPAAITGAGKTMGALAPAGMASKALQYGTEGALMGVSQNLNDLALGDPNLTAQKAISNIGFGVALGIGSAPFAQFAESAIPVATKKLSKALTGLRDVGIGTAEEPGAVANLIAKAGSVLNGKSVESNMDALFAGINRGETTIPKIANNMEEAFSHGTKVSDELTQSINKEVEPLEKIAERPFKNFPSKAELSESLAIDKGIQVGEDLGHLTHPQTAEALLKTKAMLNDYQMAANDFQREFMNKARTKIEESAIKALFENPTSAETIIKKEIANNFIEQSKKVLSASENYADYKQAETTLSKMINHLAKESVETHETLKALAGSESLMSRIAKSAVTGVGATMIGIPKPLTTAVLSAVEAYKTVRNPYEVGTALNNAFQKIKAFAEINEKVGEKIGSLSKSIFANPGARNLAVPHVSPGLPAAANSHDYDKKALKVNEIANNPQMLLDKLSKHTEDLYDSAPNVSAAIHQSLMTGAQFLAAKLPHPPSQMLLSANEWTPSKAQKQTFMTYYRAVNEPLSALKDIKSGTLNQETMEALQATQPQLLNEMRKSVMEHLDPKKARKLPYGVKIALSKFMGQPLDEGMLPSVIMSNQEVFLQPQQAGSSEKGKVTQGGLKEMSFANRSETETQEHEKEGM